MPKYLFVAIVLNLFFCTTAFSQSQKVVVHFAWPDYTTKKELVVPESDGTKLQLGKEKVR